MQYLLIIFFQILSFDIRLLIPDNFTKMLGSFVKVKERQMKMVTRTVTGKAEEASIQDDSHIAPPGHVMFLKNKNVDGDNITGQMINLGGVRMEDGRTWSMSNNLMSRTIDINENRLELGDLTMLKSFQITASHKSKTSKGSVTPALLNAGAVDLEAETSFLLDVILYGGQYTDRVITSDDIIRISGNVSSNLSDSNIYVTQYPAKHMEYSELVIPGGWSRGSELVQKGDVPTSRTGAGFTKLRTSDGSTVILSTGGHSKQHVAKPFYHPEDSINILRLPEMSWSKLEPSDHLKRSFHSVCVNRDQEVFIVGGMSMIDGRWSRIHPLNEVLQLNFTEDFEYSETLITIDSDIAELSFLTNFSFTAHKSKLFFFSGFKYPRYEENNLWKCLPPHTSRDKLPEFGTKLIRIDLDKGELLHADGPDDCGGHGGSLLMLTPDEIIITVDPHIYLYSSRMVTQPSCDLTETFGSCTLPITAKNRETYSCPTPSCLKKIHQKCDKSLRGNRCAKEKLCPACRDLDPVTWKKAKNIRLPNRN